jgi:hypothetical protein
MWVEKPADSTKCPTCLKKFAHTSARNTHVKSGCPATKPGAGSELARKTRQLEEEKTRLQARLHEQSVSLRAEAARDERAKLIGERDKLTEYRKFYDDSLKDLKKRTRELQAENERLRAENGRLKAPANTQVAAGGAGGDAAGRDVDKSQNIVFNIYGTEEWNPGKYPGLVGELSAVVRGLVTGGREDEIVPRILDACVAKMGDAPGNRTLRGYSRARGEVGTQVSEGRWEGQAPQKVAAEYATKIGEAFGDGGEPIRRQGAEELKEWAEETGGDEVVRLAVRNADRAGDTSLIFASAKGRV